MTRFGRILLVVVIAAILIAIGLTISRVAAHQPVSDDPFAWI